MIKVKNIDEAYGLREVFNVAAFNKEGDCIYKNLYCHKAIFRTENKDGKKYNTITITYPIGKISDALNFIFDEIYYVEFTSSKRMFSTGKDLPIKLTIFPEDTETWFECSSEGKQLEYHTKFYFYTVQEE